MRHSNSTSQYRTTLAAVSLLSALSLAACSGIRINRDYDPLASFEHAGRYDWADSTKVLGDNTAGGPFLERRIVRAVDHSMEALGFARDTVSETVDFIVTAFVTEPVPQDFVPVSSGGGAVSVSFGVAGGYPGYGWGYPWGWYRYPYVGTPWGWGWGWGWGSPVTSLGFSYTWVPQQGISGGSSPGTLVIDIFDGESGELIWRGWAERAMGEAAYASDMQEFLNQTVAQILQGFPPETQNDNS